MPGDMKTPNCLKHLPFKPACFRFMGRRGPETGFAVIPVDEDNLREVFLDERIDTYLADRVLVVFAFKTYNVAKQFRKIADKYQKAHSIVPTMQ
jgi:hypothetical protein